MQAAHDHDNINPYKTLHGVPEGHDARVLADKARALMPDDGVMIHVALDDTRLNTLAGLLSFFAPDVDVVIFPAWDCLPYDRVSPHGDIMARRIGALARLLQWKKETKRYPRLILTTVNAVTQRVLSKHILETAHLNVKSGGKLAQQDLQNFMTANGYMRTDTVREAGEYAIRGGIIDLYPSGYDWPLRIDLFGDDVESIKNFDPVTQRTTEKLDAFTLQPATECFLNEDTIARFRAGYRELFGVIRDDDPLYQSVSEGRRYNGMEHWMPLFTGPMKTVFDYIPRHNITLDSHAEQSRMERLTQIDDFFQARKTLETAGKNKKTPVQAGSIYKPLSPSQLYLDDAEWRTYQGNIEIFSPFGGAEEQSADDHGGRTGRDFGDIRALPDGDVFAALAEHISIARKQDKKILIAAYSTGARERLRGLLDHAGFKNFKDIENAKDLKSLNLNETGMTILELEHGFTAPDIAVLTEQDILGDRLTRRSRKHKKAENFLKEVSSLNPGDLVVHIEHGVGRFEALETLQAAGTLHDCLKIIYDGDDRLFVPVENIDVLSRFGSDEGIVRLDRLGGAGWQARKARVKKDLMKMADELLRIAASRQSQKAEKLHVSADLYREFTARFPFNETEDQQRSIDNVLEDMDSDQPMDRLICGDVGFGKTEVALRAAYVTAMNGVQVAVVVPTTLLARQHYENFTKRFAGMGLRIDQLSRMVTAKQAEQTRQGLKDGTVNIVVGTHALFADNIKFSRLGLVVIDEEQRFGVKQKEKLKALKSDVHVLTLSATPIPRTLQMAMSGVRDMSIIATPPVDRLAIRTFVLPYDPVVLREALLREHYRGGQSFYVCPRIKDLEEAEKQLKELVPELKLVSAHGQMPATELEQRMTEFYDGQYHILLATNIIENGIDVPSANTMIIHRADMFGLAQLYQIRGRIGRSKQRAYAYLTFDPRKKLTDYAQKRLEVIETLDTLGAGFQLASHDMDIRGAGNLLGEEQSGHIKEVGVELYQQMLEEAVAAAREGLGWEEAGAEKWSPQINMGTSVLIPEHYVEDLSTRMSLYRRLTDLENKDEIEGFAAELIDRFGPLPDEVENLLQIVEIKQLCRRAGIVKIDSGPKGAVIEFHKDTPPNVAALMGWIQQKGGAVKLRPDQKLVVIRHWEKTEQRVKGTRSLMTELAQLV